VGGGWSGRGAEGERATQTSSMTYHIRIPHPRIMCFNGSSKKRRHAPQRVGRSRDTEQGVKGAYFVCFSALVRSSMLCFPLPAAGARTGGAEAGAGIYAGVGG
jgi:hypothetical protein